MWLRENDTGGFGFAHGPTIQINMSTTSKGPDSLSPVFVENVGLNETVVDTQTFIEGGFSSGVSPQPFATEFNFTQPFSYDPKSGNLLVEIRNYGGFYMPGIGVASMDAVDLPNDGVSILVGDFPDSASGSFFSRGFVMRLDYNIVPEPSSLALLAFGGLILTWFCWNQSRHKG